MSLPRRDCLKCFDYYFVRLATIPPHQVKYGCRSCEGTWKPQSIRTEGGHNSHSELNLRLSIIFIVNILPTKWLGITIQSAWMASPINFQNDMQNIRMNGNSHSECNGSRCLCVAALYCCSLLVSAEELLVSAIPSFRVVHIWWFCGTIQFNVDHEYHSEYRRSRCDSHLVKRLFAMQINRTRRKNATSAAVEAK